MKLVNNSTESHYSSVAKKRIGPGCCSRELTDFSDFLEDLQKRCKAFEFRLSERDLSILRRFLDKCGRPIDMTAALEAAKDPLGQKAIDDRMNMREILRHRLDKKIIDEERMREARVNAESNYLDDKGNPIPKATALDVEGSRKEIKPEIDKGMSEDLDAVMANNMAVMSGEKPKAEKKQVPESVRKAISIDEVNNMRKGKDAVGVMTIPGVPNLPGIQNVAADLVKEARYAQAAQQRMTAPPAFGELKPTDSPYVVTTDSILKGFKRPVK